MLANVADAKHIFLQAVECHEPEGWPRFLNDACGNDDALRARVEALLAAYRQPNPLLDDRNSEPTLDQPPISERAGTVIGPYKLLEQIGEGGMGVVFMAEQTEPIQRTVALKIIKPGMDTRQVIARFEAERQVLAMMDHPNIARVLDAGTTGDRSNGSESAADARVGEGETSRGGESECQGSHRVSPLFVSPSSIARPFFVMELVKGTPITKYCDDKQLSLRERLELFMPVCQAVQHAHQKGIIHRDLKPSNVLVAEYDDKPVPKVIDFGVAKATAQRLTEKTMFTAFGQLIGTFEYMSPEQAKLNQLDIDTRSDIYSLGVLLYELLTGSTPLERHRLETIAFDETLRIIREEEPPTPSTRLSSRLAPRAVAEGAKNSTSTDDGSRSEPATLASIAANRHSEPGRLSKELRGELDWIVMKCLEKDRNRRYETVSAFAADIGHYLANETVTAAAPTQLYRIGKFVRRNRGPVAAAFLVALAILGGIAASTWQAVRATRAERAAVTNAALARASAEAERQAKEAESAQRKQAEAISNFLISAFNAEQPEHDIQALAQILKQSSQELQSAYPNDPAARALFLATMGRAHYGLRRFDEAEKMYRHCLELASDPGLIDRVRHELATCLIRGGKSVEATPMLYEFFVGRLNRSAAPQANELLAILPTLPDVTATVDGTPGMDGLDLDGDNDYVVLPRMFFDARPPWTLEAIVWPVEIDPSNPQTGSPAGWSSLISAADAGSIGLESLKQRWTIELYAVGVAGAEWVDNYASASARNEVPLRRWQHVAGVWDGNELRLYFDGQLQDTRRGVTYCTQLSNSPMFLGADPANLAFVEQVAEGFFHGRLRGARISHAAEYTNSFTPPERLEKTPGTIGLYDFTIDTGQYAIDRSGHGNHGIIVGAKFMKTESD